MRLTKKSLIRLVILFLPLCSFAQQKKDSTGIIANKIFNFQFHYTYEMPGGDLAQTFGTIHNIGFGCLFKTKRNWTYSLDGSYQFGYYVSDYINQSIQGNIGNSSGSISNLSGGNALVYLGERGLNAFIKAGKIFPLPGKNLNSGISLMAGIGFVSHMININAPMNDVPTLTDDLKKGYDRLTMGWALTQFAGYHFHSHYRLVNFYIGFDLIEAFTKNIRGYNYDQMSYDKAQKLDIYFGPRFGWMIPIYMTTKEVDEFYYK
ncbi:MAG: hypothetical protein ACHQK8_06550 [Bacteroidia bacterium]